MTTTLNPGDKVRVLTSGGHLTVGDTATVETPDIGGAWVTIPSHDKPVWAGIRDIELVPEYVKLPESAADRERFRQVAEQAAVALEAKRDGLHVITERADGPDLHDLVRLIEYLREHDLDAHVVHYNDAKVLTVDMGNGWGWHEGGPLGEEHFVGPDGTVYDANREAL